MGYIDLRALLVLLLFSVTSIAFGQDVTTSATPADKLLEQLSGTSAEGKQEILKAALNDEGEQILKVFSLIKDRTQVEGEKKEIESILQQDAKARKVISGLIMLAGAPGHEKQSTDLANILAKLLKENLAEGVDRFITRMLGELGNPIGVDPMRRDVLSDQNWSDESIRSLSSIPGDTAQQALIQILQSGPTRWKAAACSALVMRGETENVTPALLQSLKEEDADVVEAALDALIGLGAPEAMKPLIDRLSAAPEGGKSKYADQVLELAQRLEATRYETYSRNLLDALLLSRGIPENRRGIAEKLRQRCRSWQVLFDGESAKGWIGKTEGYQFVDGEIRCKADSGGNIYTEDEFSDFIFRFEFKLAPGSNNGVGIRTPSEGDAAFDGMEVQVLDNTAEKYKDLKPYQMHGSIYGVVPAERGHLLPVGQWNFQEIRCVGRRVTVTLNGTTILDADLDVASRNGTLDGADHPGLKRSTGHIGFLGHGHAVAFRNLRVRPLTSK